MTDFQIREFRLGGPRGDGRHPYVNQTGAFIGPIAWGMARDATGSFHLGFIGLAIIQALALVFVALLVPHTRKKGVAVQVSG